MDDKEKRPARSSLSERPLEQLLLSLADRPIPNLTVLLVARSDYIGGMHELNLPRMRAGSNWLEISAFTEKQGRALLTSSGLKIGNGLLHSVMREVTEIEETEGLVRPITLNFAGLILSRFSSLPKSFRARSLIETYLQESVGSRDLAQVAPPVLRSMLTRAGTKRPRTVVDLMKNTALKEGLIRGCLLRLGNRGLVRCLDEDQNAWEISHDFLAQQLRSVVVRWEMRFWHQVRPWLAPAVLGLCLVAALLAPLTRDYLVIRNITPLGVTVLRGEQEVLGIHVTERERLDLEALAFWLSWDKSPITLDLSRTQVSDLEHLRDLTQLQGLNLRSTRVVNLDPIGRHNQLKDLDLSYTKANMEPLRNLSQLQTLNLTSTQIVDLEPLRHLTQLQQLELYRTRVYDLEPLSSLTQLKTLIIDHTQVVELEALSNLTQLQSLQLRETQVSNLEPLSNLTLLRTLNLTKTKVVDLEPLSNLTLLQSLNLYDTQVMDLEPLSNLTLLQSLDLSNTLVSNLEPLHSLTQLQSLDLYRTNVSDLEPLRFLTQLQALDLTLPSVVDANPLHNLTQLRNLQLAFSQVSDLDFLRHLTQLQILDLSSTAVTNLEPLRHLGQLQNLDLSYNAQVADTEPLRSLTQLRVLNLYRTSVSNLKPLRTLTQLERLDLFGTDVSDLGPLSHLTQLQELILDKARRAELEPHVEVLKQKIPGLLVDWQEKATIGIPYEAQALRDALKQLEGTGNDGR